MNVRQCDICKSYSAPQAHWHFITEGRINPTDWLLPKHWCPTCMKLVQDYIATLST